jgi:hypothetical protein
MENIIEVSLGGLLLLGLVATVVRNIFADVTRRRWR